MRKKSANVGFKAYFSAKPTINSGSYKDTIRIFYPIVITALNGVYSVPLSRGGAVW